MKINEIYGIQDPEYLRKHTNDISTKTTVAYIRKNEEKLQIALQKYKEGCIIYRGMKSTKSTLLIDPTASTRISSNSSNYFNILVSSLLPTWENYPKRTKSIIGATTDKNVSYYGKKFIVLPIGDPTIAVSPVDDFWYSFIPNAEALRIPQLNNCLSFINELQFKDKFSDRNESQVLEFLNAVQREYNTNKNFLDDPRYNSYINYYPKIKQQLSAMFANYPSLFAALNTIYSPEKNGFTLTKFSNLNVADNREVWFSSPALLVRSDVLEKFFNENK